MHFTNAALLGLASVAAASNVKRQYGAPSTNEAATSGGVTHKVMVGDGGLMFKPNTLKANVGDMVEFWFYPEAHSVVEGTFDKPCQPSSKNAAFSGLIPVKSGMSETTFMFKIQNEDPLWLYCSAETHCQSGMAMVINPEQGGSTLQDYVKAAAKTSSSGTPSEKWQAGDLNAMLMEGGSTPTSGNGTGPAATPSDAAGNLGTSGSMVGAVAGLMAWALL